MKVEEKEYKICTNCIVNSIDPEIKFDDQGVCDHCNNFYGNISGLLWVDSFSGNYYITTGMYDTLFPLTLSGSLVPFIQGQNIYSGLFLIPSGQKGYPTGFSISIRKPNYYDISGNIAKYIVSGENFIYSGLIEG
jgi:hypothetical protein